MIRRLCTALLVAFVALLATPASARQHAEQPPARPTTPAEVLSRARAAARDRHASRIAVELRSPDGRVRRTTILLAWMPANTRPPSSTKPPQLPATPVAPADDIPADVIEPPVPLSKVAVLSLRLGWNLRIDLRDSTLLAINARNDHLMVEHEFDKPITLERLGTLVPPLPLPQLAWILPSNLPSDEFPVIGRVAWSDTLDTADPARILIRGTTTSGEVLFFTDASSGRLARIEADVGTAASLSRLTLTCTPCSEADLEPISTAGRSRVDSLSDLRPAPAAFSRGDTLIGLGLMTPAKESWSLPAALAPSPDADPADSLAILVLYRALPGPNPIANLALGAARQAGADLERRNAHERSRLVRVLVRPVAIMEVGDVTPERIDALARETGSPDFLWSSVGEVFLRRIAGADPVAIVGLDRDQRVIGIITLRDESRPRADLADEIAETMEPRAPSPDLP